MSTSSNDRRRGSQPVENNEDGYVALYERTVHNPQGVSLHRESGYDWDIWVDEDAIGRTLSFNQQMMTADVALALACAITEGVTVLLGGQAAEVGGGDGAPAAAAFTPESVGWQAGVRLGACPSWCDGRHECVVNDEYVGEALVGGDAIHTSADVQICDETATTRGDGAPLYLEAYPDGAAGPRLTFVVCDDARFTPASARQAAAELLRLAALAEDES